MYPKKLTVDLIEETVKECHSNYFFPFDNGSLVGYIHPDVEYDLHDSVTQSDRELMGEFITDSGLVRGFVPVIRGVKLYRSTFYPSRSDDPYGIMLAMAYTKEFRSYAPPAKWYFNTEDMYDGKRRYFHTRVITTHASLADNPDTLYHTPITWEWDKEKFYADYEKTGYQTI